MKGAIILTLLLSGVVLSSESISLDIHLKRRELEEIREFRKMVRELLKEEYEEVAPGIKVKKGCEVVRGIASWYGGRFHGRRTSSGETFNLFKFTAASKTFPLGTYVLVRNEENGKVITARINDRGPHTGGRIIDLSMAAAFKLGMVRSGISMVQVVPLRCLSPDSVTSLYDEMLLDLANTY